MKLVLLYNSPEQWADQVVARLLALGCSEAYVEAARRTIIERAQA